MRLRVSKPRILIGSTALFIVTVTPVCATNNTTPSINVQLGPRPYYLVEKMTDGKLKDELMRCSEGPFQPTDFSIGHRGAPLQIPEHTKESYQAAARMGAGIIECDVTFTKDAALVCRHAQCDLHTTTDILDTELASRCSKPFTPAEFDEEGNRVKDASAKCCASDLTLEQFKMLKGKMDASDPAATTVEEYLGGTAKWRTDLYSTGGTLLTHAESIELIGSLGAKYTPELKGGEEDDIKAVFGSQKAYAQKLIDEYVAAGVPPKKVWPQSFNLNDVFYWIKNTDYGKQAVWLDGRDPSEVSDNPPPHKEFNDLKAAGLNIIAPPMPTLLSVEDGEIVPSNYAHRANKAKLDIIAWSLERSGRIVEEVLPTKDTDEPSYYYQTTLDALENDGDIMVTTDVLAQQVGIIGFFSDWPATTTYYANCKGL